MKWRSCAFVMALLVWWVPIAGSEQIVLVGGGDTAYPTGWFTNSVRKRGASVYEHIEPLMKGADLRFLNLESPVTLRRPIAQKEYPLVTHPDFLKWMVNSGFNLFSLANNHTGDAGRPGVQDTFDHLKKLSTSGRPLFWAGAGLTRQAAKETTFFTVPGKKTRVAFLAFRNSGSPLANSLRNAIPQIRQAAKKAQFVIVSAHGGAEYRNIPGAWKPKLFRSMIDAGAHVVLGHGPHNPQGVERYKGGVIYYSLGNLSFGTRPRKHRTKGMLLRGLWARVVFANNRIAQAQAVPLFVDNRRPWTVDGDTMPVRLFTPVPATGKHAAQMLTELAEWSAGIKGNKTHIVACGTAYCIRSAAK